MTPIPDNLTTPIQDEDAPQSPILSRHSRNLSNDSTRENPGEAAGSITKYGIGDSKQYYNPKF